MPRTSDSGRAALTHLIRAPTLPNVLPELTTPGLMGFVVLNAMRADLHHPDSRQRRLAGRDLAYRKGLYLPDSHTASESRCCRTGGSASGGRPGPLEKTQEEQREQAQTHQAYQSPLDQVKPVPIHDLTLPFLNCLQCLS